MQRMSMEKIRLRALEMEDLATIYEVENDRDHWEVSNTNVPYSRQSLIDYIAGSSSDIYADKQVRLMAENAYGEVIGIVDLVDFDPRHLRAELGIMVIGKWQGRGLGKLLVGELLAYAREVLHLHQVYAIVAAGNERAAKMLVSAGFQGDKVLREWLCKADGYEDAYFFQYFL